MAACSTVCRLTNEKFLFLNGGKSLNNLLLRDVLHFRDKYIKYCRPLASHYSCGPYFKQMYYRAERVIVGQSFVNETLKMGFIKSCCKYSTKCSVKQENERNIVKFRHALQRGPSLNYFIGNSASPTDTKVSHSEETGVTVEAHPYLTHSALHGNSRKVYFEVYGCQMNVNDTEIAWSILQNYGYVRTVDILQADVILVMTCAIREGAENKIWNYLQFLKGLKKRRLKDVSPPIKIGILGCMAERLKEKILDREKIIDLVAGPDSYRDLPAMLSVVDDANAAVNVMLSLDETYADVVPVRLNSSSSSAFVSIMRGCDNMCSYCIVPFTRGRERSRPMKSILEEIRSLSEQGIKEVILLGQNVNSYCDVSEVTHALNQTTKMADGFTTIYKSKIGGLRFVNLLEKVSEVDVEMRIRFTSPHPKDFPNEVLHLIKERPNICDQLHMPAQSGNDNVLNSMRRGYTREAYLKLIDNVRSILPDVSLSSDFICGFCGEDEEAHQDTISLIELVKYNSAFVFPYSLREKTHAHRRLVDDVQTDVKKRRANEVVDVYRREASKLNRAMIGQHQLILIEGTSKRSDEFLAGRNEGFTKVIVPNVRIPIDGSTSKLSMSVGDYVAVKIIDGNSQVLKGIPINKTTLSSYSSSIQENY